ncbi:queuosine precursor transporter [uncultured Amaricoccus sp.]|uniref:queuosine precursor transporter n=1 Tax=uncultured Amaricoccus sp. TaxID=339341 RepID=UPI00260D0235|nr:queuosine precursor transporter [uncultured Amaricoccus sp.]
MNRTLLAGTVAMAIVVLASNILVQFLVGDWLTWGAFTYPFAFLVTDLMNRLQGPAAARRVVYAGFVTGLVCSVIGTQIVGEFGPLVSPRVAAASLTAFLLGQLLDITVFNRLRRGVWWRAPLVSSVLGSAVDTLAFFTMAFSASLAFLAPGVDVAWANEPVAMLGRGPVLPLWISLAVADFGVKLAIAVFALAPFRALVWQYRAGAAK